MDGLNLKKCMRFKRKATIKFFVGIKFKGRKFIIRAEYFDANNIFSHRFLLNIKLRPKIVQDLSTSTKKALWKKRLENSIEQKVQQIQRITGRNGKTKYRSWTYAKKEVLCEPVWISDAFELCEPELYKIVTTITRDDESRKFYTVPVGWWNQLTKFEESLSANN